MIIVDVAIVGSGPAAWTAACVFTKNGKSVAIFDDGSESNRHIAILPKGRAFLNNLGLSIESLGHSIECLQFAYQQNKAAFHTADMTPIATSIATNKLTNALQSLTTPLRLTRCAELTKTQRGWKLQDDTGNQIEAHLVVGADGKNGIVAKSVHSPLLSRETGHSALSVFVTHPHTHHDISTEWILQHGPLNVLPSNASNDTSYHSGIVWMDKTSFHENRISSLATLTDDLNAFTQHTYGPMTLDSAPVLWKTSIGLRPLMAGKSWLLLGEAAHVMPPIGAQGFNLTLKNIAALDAHLQRTLPLWLLNPVLVANTKLRLAFVQSLLSAQTLPTPIGAYMRKQAFETMKTIPGLKSQLTSIGLGL